MEPNKTSVTGLFSTHYQYQIPIFQRGYVWTLEKQVMPLWADIQDRADARIEHESLQNSVGGHVLKPIQKHFLGSVVLTPVQSSFGRVPAYEVIDGQQRSTTLQLLLLAFGRAAGDLGDQSVPQMLSTLIRNPGPYTDNTDYFKVWPTQAGQGEIRFLCEAKSTKEVEQAYPAREGRSKVERPLMVQTYLYFYYACLAYLQGTDLGDAFDSVLDRTFSDELIARIRRNNEIEPITPVSDFDPMRARALYMALSENVQIMTLRLESEDDPQVIFETLNARGEPLLASDLIRNFVFLEAARMKKDVDTLYSKYWNDFDLVAAKAKGSSANPYWREKERQGRLTYPRIDLFFYNYVILRSREITLTSHVFQSFKTWWQKGSRELDVELGRIVTSSIHFKELVSPEGTSYLAEFARLIKALDVGTVTPVYLALRERLSEDSGALRQALADLASYLTRRAVCGMTTKGYNRFFMKVLQSVLQAESNPEVALRDALLSAESDSEQWPSDAKFAEKWRHRPVYEELKPAKVCGILRALEYSARGSKQGSNHVPTQAELSVEHVMPRSWERVPAYVIEGMAEEQRAARNIRMHGFGNLSLLTPSLNGSVGNDEFADSLGSDGKKVLGKRSRLGESALLMNIYFKKDAQNSWGEAEIAARAESLLEAALLVWGRPANAVPTPDMVMRALAGR